MRSTLAFARLLMLAPVLTMAGCVTNTTGVDVSGICSEAWKPITYSSSRDTPETVDQVRANNRAHQAFCKD